MSSSIENVLYHSYRQNLKEIREKKNENTKTVKNFKFHLGLWKYCFQMLFDKNN